MEKVKLKRGYIAEACRIVGVSRTTFDKARKKQGTEDVLTQKEIRVLSVYNDLIKEAEEQLVKLTNNAIA